MEFGEFVVEGVVREILEEVCVDVEVVVYFVYLDILLIGQVSILNIVLRLCVLNVLIVFNG